MIIDGRISPANADDIRVDSIAAQLEEAEQQRLTGCRIKRSSTSTTT